MQTRFYHMLAATALLFGQPGNATSLSQTSLSQTEGKSLALGDEPIDLAEVSNDVLSQITAQAEARSEALTEAMKCAKTDKSKSSKSGKQGDAKNKGKEAKDKAKADKAKTKAQKQSKKAQDKKNDTEKAKKDAKGEKDAAKKNDDKKAKADGKKGDGKSAKAKAAKKVAQGKGAAAKNDEKPCDKKAQKCLEKSVLKKVHKGNQKQAQADMIKEMRKMHLNAEMRANTQSGDRYKKLMTAARENVSFVDDLVEAKKLEGIPRNMLKGLSNEMLHDVMEGKSPLCAIEKRATNGKMMAFNIGKAYGLIPPMAQQRTYLDDDHEFWSQKYLAQTMSDSELEAMTDAEVEALMDDNLTLSQIYPNIQC